MALDFLQPFLDSRITFSRGSNATLVDSTGKITYAPANLVQRSEEFDNAYWTKTRSSITPNSTAAPDGATTADKLIEDSTASNTHFIVTQFALSVAPSTIVYSVYLKAAERTRAQVDVSDNATGGMVLNVNLSDGTFTSSSSGSWSGVFAGVQSVGSGWYRCFLRGTQSSGFVLPRVFIADASGSTTYTGNGTSGIFIWGAQLEPVTYQTTPSTYVATTSAAYYGPRFDYDPVTLAAKGLLIEEARTNLLLRSQLIGGTSWTSSGVTSTTNSIVAPDGTTTATLVTEDTATSAHAIFGTNMTLAVAANTISVFIKAGTRRYVSIRGETTAVATYSWVTLDTTTGTINANAAVTSSSATAFGNGWWRVTMTWANTNGGLGVANIVFAGSDVSTAPATSSVLGNLYLGNGSTFYLWGAQVEAGAFATSYIPTVASTVTRSADVATMTGTNFSSWYNQSEGTFVADASSTASSARSLTASAGAVTDQLFLQSGAATSIAFSVFTASAFVAQLGSLPASLIKKVAGAYKVNDFAASVDGGAVATDTSGALATYSQLNLGANALGSGGFLNGHIRSIAYYNTRLPNAQLQTLTAPPLTTTLTMSFTNQAYTVGV
jgi:hypothetical protein